MIKNIEHARIVQARRVINGKRGYAKAVRRYLLRNESQSYKQIISSLPVQWHE